MNKLFLSLVAVSCSLCLISCSKAGNNDKNEDDGEGASPYKEYFAKVDIPQKQLSDILAANEEYMMGGWAYLKSNDSTTSEHIDVYHFCCSFEFDSDNHDFTDYGVPFKITYNTSDEGSCKAVGFAKPDSISVYKATEAYFSDPEGIEIMRGMNPMFMDNNDGIAYGLCYFPILDNTLILKAGVKNWNHITAYLSEVGGDERIFPSEKDDEVILDIYEMNIFHKIIAETPRMTYKADNGLAIEMQMLCPPQNVSSNIKAIVMGTIHNGEINRDFMTPINSDGEFIIDGTYNGFKFEDSYLGGVKWTKDKLIVNDHGNKYELYLEKN